MTESVPERPATFTSVLRVREFRALIGAQVLSELGDQLARVALSILVYRRTGSALLTALTYALTYLPAALGGPLLGPFADRVSRRSVLIVCDLARVVIVGLMAVPGVPIYLLLGLLAVATLLDGPFDAARGAILPDILDGELYVTGQGLSRLLHQTSQLLGFALGGLVLVVFPPRGALAVDAITFLVSALVVALGVGSHHMAQIEERGSFRVELVEGVQAIRSNPMLLELVMLAWVTCAFAVVPEALAAPYSAALSAGNAATGLILAAGPMGTVLGVLVMTRWASTQQRAASMRPLAAFACVPLLACFAHPPLPVLLGLLLVSGAAMSFNIAANQAFVLAVPQAMRGRAFGIANGGLSVSQGLGFLAAGVLAEFMAPWEVVGVVGAVGLISVLMLVQTGRARRSTSTRTLSLPLVASTVDR
jgi:MFS family permease